ncbi:hypothetical protein QR98_0106010 [Sarcoptes scabiei]|uniref:Uncharacterized protein n=1 Tax=Sarcoptes scabiei TaxID=52283 RepID=A0A132ANB3_SARSC|nr:hypothetical protein QR98_0106010 [Sarcoptes scabiei]
MSFRTNNFLLPPFQVKKGRLGGGRGDRPTPVSSPTWASPTQRHASSFQRRKSKGAPHPAHAKQAPTPNRPPARKVVTPS